MPLIPQPQKQPEQPVEHQAAREEYPNNGYQVQTLPDGARALVVHVPMPRKVMILLMSAEEAEAIGKKLAAPSVALPNGLVPRTAPS